MHMALLAVGRVALLTASSVGARAQAGTARQGADPRCLASIPDSAMRRVEVVLEAELTDSTDGPILPELDLFAQSVADEARALLGASHDSVPAGEPTVTWQGLGASLSVVVRRDGHITTTVPTFDLPADVVPVMAGTAAAELLERAVAAVDSAGGFVMWPDGFAPDSVAFRLVVRYPLVTADRTVLPFRVRRAFPLMTIRMPVGESVVTTRQAKVRYPTGSWQNGVSGTVLLVFWVDTTGRADTMVVKDLWPPNRPRLTGSPAAYYERFRQAAISALPDMRFKPARLGGCKVRQLVEVPFEFRLNQ